MFESNRIQISSRGFRVGAKPWEMPAVQSCTCPSCAEPLLQLEDGCGVCGWLPENPLEPDE